MKRSISLRFAMGVTLFACLAMFLLSACGNDGTGATDLPDGNDAEVYLTPIINEDGKYEYSGGGTTIIVENWEQLPDPEETPSGAELEEAYLTPEQTDEGVFTYRDEQGVALAVWEMLPLPQDQQLTLREGDPHAHLDWDNDAGECFTSKDKYDPVDGAITLYAMFFLSPAGDSYLGYLDDATQTYTWLEPPQEGDFNLKLTVNNDNAISLALKNASTNLITYRGCYGLEPIEP